MEIFESEEHFKKGIKKLLTGSFFGKFKVDDLKPVSYDIYGEKTYTSADSKHKSESTMRSLLRRYTGTQCVSNFRPTAVFCLYQNFMKAVKPFGICLWVMVVVYLVRLYLMLIM